MKTSHSHTRTARLRRAIGLFILIGGTALATSRVVSDDQTPGDGKKGDVDPAAKAAMEAWLKTGTPGEHHAHLKALAGKWKAVGRFRMSPDAPWTESNSTSEATWILGGRFLQQKFTGDTVDEQMGRRFEGFGLIGYDNYSKHYTAIWTDNMSTMMLSAEGACSSSGNEITLEGRYKDPATGRTKTFKWIYRVRNSTQYVLEAYETGPDGKEFKNMEIVHTRRK
ncbi:MAG: DUF1579 domain-containing protein [Phycisphaerae bacterium]